MTATDEAAPVAVAEPSRAGHLSRITALDGLRGLGALFVLSNHMVISTIAPLSMQDRTTTTHLAQGSLAWWFAFTPLHFLYDGTPWVYMFFVLSGFVLALPALKRGYKWFDSSYYPRRLVRLYLPVWGALVIAVVLREIFSRHTVVGATVFVNSAAAPMTLKGGLGAAALIGQNGNPAFISPLWSLRWEVIFSLLLPGFLLVPIYTRNRPRLAALAALASVALVGVGVHQGNLYLWFMPMFMLGSLMAFRQPEMASLAATLRARLGGVGFNVVVPLVVVALLTSDNWIFAITSRHILVLRMVATMVPLCAACGIVFLAMHLRPFTAMLSSRFGRWIGTRSYSLYVTHICVLLTVVFLMGGRPNAVAFFAICIPSALLLAEIFWRVVENPAVRLARSVGTTVRRWSASARTSPVAAPEPSA